jgi:hypothetical protein
MHNKQASGFRALIILVIIVLLSIARGRIIEYFGNNFFTRYFLGVCVFVPMLFIYKRGKA